MRLALTVSDHGWGHLNRSLVAGAEALRRGHDLAMVVGRSMTTTVRHALPGATVIEGALDRGYVFSEAGRADIDATRARAAAIAAGPDAAIREAVARWRPDMLLADATPWASTLAHALGVPAVLCSNFAWDDQFAALLGECEEVRGVRAQVQAFDLALELPLGSGLPSVKRRVRMPLLGRRPAGALPEALADGAPYLAWAMGGTAPAVQPLALLDALGGLCVERGLRLAVTEALAPHAGPAAVALPDDCSWPDVLAGAGVVVTKGGYSTLAETMQGRGRAVVIGITGTPEERGMVEEITDRGDGAAVSVLAPDFLAAAVAAVNAALDWPPRIPALATGEIAVLDAIEALLAE